MSKQTVEILTNKEIIALNQDKALVQGRRILVENNIEVWLKPLGDGKEKAIAILNRGEEEKQFILNADKSGISRKSKIRDLWLHKNLGKIGQGKTFILPGHGIIVLRGS